MLDDFARLVEQLFPGDSGPEWVKYLVAACRVKSGTQLAQEAEAHSLNRAKLNRIVSSPDVLSHVLGINPAEITDQVRQRAVKQLGQMLLGAAAETAFTSNYEERLRAQVLQLTDLRERRSSTDFRVAQGENTWCNLNIKFHGTRFERAKVLVGLDPEDSFALATYKIWGAVDQQSRDSIPHVFAIVGVPAASAQAIGEAIPGHLREAAALISGARKKDLGKRSFEDALINHITSTGAPPFPHTYQEIAKADWYMLSAAKAMRLLKERLFQRVYALRVHRFAQNYPSAEVDMHFSLKDDLLPFEHFLLHLQEEGTATMLQHLKEGVY